MENSKEFKPKAEDEIRNDVLSELKEMEYNLDDDNLKPLIDKMVNKEIERQNERVEAHKNLSKAIGQKKKRDDLLAEKDKKLAELLASQANDDDEPDDPKAKPKEVPAVNEDENTKKLSSLEKELSELKSVQQRNQYSHFSDAEYNSINAIATANGISFSEALNNDPVVKNFVETNQINQRIAGATANPSNRINPNVNMAPESVDLNNPDHIKWLKSDPKNQEAYDVWMEKGGFNNLKIK